MSFSSAVRSAEVFISKAWYLDSETHPESKPTARERAKRWLFCIVDASFRANGSASIDCRTGEALTSTVFGRGRVSVAGGGRW